MPTKHPVASTEICHTGYS